MTFSVTKSTSNSELAVLDPGVAAMKGAGKEVGLTGQGEEAAAAGDGAFAELFSALAGVFDSETEGQTAAPDDVAADDADSIIGQGEQEPENNDALLSRLAQSSQFLRAENPISDASTVDAAAVEGAVGGNILPNAASLSPQLDETAIDGSQVTATGVADIDSDGNELTDTESAEVESTNGAAVTADVPWINSKSGTPVAELSTTDKKDQPDQMQSPQLKRDSRLATHAGIAAEFPVAAETKAADTEQSITEPVDAAVMIAATGQPISNQLAADNTARTERLTETAEEKIGVNADPVSLTRSGPATARQAQAADIQLNSAGSNGVNMAQMDTEQAMQQDSSTLTDVQDFSAVLEHARGNEQTDHLSRTAKAPNLTPAEQQVLDKRVNLHDSRASSELNEKIAVMVNKDMQTATIRLDPAELGSMQIKLVIQNDQANVVIHTQNHQSRDLLDQSMPRLREMLQQQGIALGDSQVQSDSGRQQQSNYQQSSYASGQKNSNNTANAVFDSHSESPVTTQYWQDSAKGVDFYA